MTQKIARQHRRELCGAFIGQLDGDGLVKVGEFHLDFFQHMFAAGQQNISGSAHIFYPFKQDLPRHSFVYFDARNLERVDGDVLINGVLQSRDPLDQVNSRRRHYQVETAGFKKAADQLLDTALVISELDMGGGNRKG